MRTRLYVEIIIRAFIETPIVLRWVRPWCSRKKKESTKEIDGKPWSAGWIITIKLARKFDYVKDEY